MTSDEIRELFLSFFAERGHLRIPSASLVPAADDTSTLTTVAGMQPLKPYFTGRERPPAVRMASCQKCFRTVDLDIVGTTARHLTFFEMLGNFSIGDYFKQGAVEFAWELARDGFGFPAEAIWITVFEGDDALGSAPMRRRSRRGSRWGCRASGSWRSVATTTSGRAGRPGRAARTPSSTSTAASSSAAPTICPAARTRASSSSGTSSS